MRYLLVLSLLIISKIASAEGGSVAGNCANYSAKLVSLQGALLIAADGQGHWRPGQLNQTICQGSQVHVQPYSRASLLLPGGIILRMDEGTVLTINGIDPEKPTLLNLLKGFIHFISRTPRQLEINTPIANAGPEGTEFAIKVDDTNAALWVYEGKVKFYNAQGDVRLKPGEAAQAAAGQAPQAKIDIQPKDAVNWALYYPPLLPYPAKDQVIDSELRAAIDEFRRGRTSEALARMDKLGSEQQAPYFYKVRAAMRLTLGRVDLARQDIQALLATNPKDSDALALQSVMTLTQNRKDEAHQVAQQAIKNNPQSSTAYSALSYAEQGRFDLDKALKAAEKAANLAPQDAMMWARKAELELSQGDTSGSKEAAKKALELDPGLERTQTVMGFAHLLRMDADDALTAFNQAVELDSTSPLARLGLGLAKIRNGDLEDGRKDLEIAAILDPKNSIVRSYLGKAYYEERRPEMADEQYKLAKERDPKDPTPYFYDAINKQTTNRPVEALHDMQKAIELNDNRGVYRSKLMLDSDSAARSSAVARIYNDLGFSHRALLEGWQSVNRDSLDYSGHRLLADSYSALPRHELARTSELLQSQLLQPINNTPVQPQLGERNLAILQGSGPAGSGFNEFNPLFSKNGFSLQASGVVGSLDTYGDEVVHSGIWDKFSYSLGQFHHQTRGFRPNNGIDQNIYNAFIQGNPTEGVNLEAEYRHRDVEHGDLFYYGDLDFYYNKPFVGLPDFKRNVNSDTFRIGSRITFSPENILIGSLNFIDYIDQFNNFVLIKSRNISQRGFLGEVQYQHKNEPYNLVVGGGGYDLTNKLSLSQLLAPPSNKNFNTQYYNLYTYNYLNFLNNLTLTLGVSYDSLQHALNGSQKLSQVNPKFGIQWEISKDTILRAAAFRTLSRGVYVDATIEPTQVAGFNQLFDNWPATRAWRYGVGLDHKINRNMLIGAEVSKRDLIQPVINFPSDFAVLKEKWEERLFRSYWYWELSDFLSSSIEYQYDAVATANNNANGTYKNHIVPLSLRYFDKNYGFGASATVTYINQNAYIPNLKGLANPDINSNFALLDLALRFRLPSRHGLITFSANNILDKKFNFVGQNLLGLRNSRFEESPLFFPERTFFVNFTLAF